MGRESSGSSSYVSGISLGPFGTSIYEPAIACHSQSVSSWFFKGWHGLEGWADSRLEGPLAALAQMSCQRPGVEVSGRSRPKRKGAVPEMAGKSPTEWWIVVDCWVEWLTTLLVDVIGMIGSGWSRMPGKHPTMHFRLVTWSDWVWGVVGTGMIQMMLLMMIPNVISCNIHSQ